VDIRIDLKQRPGVAGKRFAHRERQLVLQGEVGDEFALEEERPLQGHDGFHSGRLRRCDGSLELFSANTDMITLSIGFYVFRPGRLAHVQTAACDLALGF
jgi:hypothetical protein